MPDTLARPALLLPTVSIVETTMRHARRMVAMALAGAVVATATLLVERLWTAPALATAAEHHALARKLAADVRLADQDTLMAAKLAVTTGDGQWAARYSQGLPRLGAAIDAATALAPAAVAERYRERTRQASEALMRMQGEAFAALSAGQADRARARIADPDYAVQSRLLADATEELTAATLQSTDAEMRAVRWRSFAITAAILALALGAGVSLWRRLTTGLDRSRSSLLDAEERVQRLAASDLLTGLDNRAALHDAMHAAMAQARRHAQTLAVLMVDLDRFKPVNDRHGHMVGDMVLKEVSRRLDRCLRQSDLRARYGGDEFVVALEEFEGPGTARAAAERIRRTLSQPMKFGDLVVTIGASIGIARFPQDAQTDDELLRKADSALYRAKQGGRDSVCLYDAALDEALLERDAIEQALRHGIAAGELVPFYQPIVDLAGRRVRSLELLCRWRHPSRGLLGPDKFIAVAEDTGLIGPLTLSLLRQACRDLALFPPHWRLSFNVVPQQIQDETLVPQLLAILDEHGVPPERIDVELTETALVNDTARARHVILALKRTGMTVTLDDFGTGYSSLSYLAEMTFDKIKIDRSFVHTLRERPQSAKIVAAIVGLSRSLGVDTVAEGVETEAEARQLLDLGCTFGQGYLFGRPVSARDTSLSVLAMSEHLDAVAADPIA